MTRDVLISPFTSVLAVVALIITGTPGIGVSWIVSLKVISVIGGVGVTVGVAVGVSVFVGVGVTVGDGVKVGVFVEVGV